MNNYKKLFEPITIGSMDLKNRIVMAPHGSADRAYLGFVPDREIDYYAERAKGGTALLETVNVCIDSALGKVGQGMMSIDNNKYITGMANLAEAVHLWNAKLCVQLMHAGRDTSLAATEGLQPVSASAVSFVRPGWTITARELSLNEIEEVEKKFAQGAYRAKVAGVDAVELHGAFGHCLIAQFLSPYTNKRIDHYGCTLENRMRFALEIVKKTREKVGYDYPIIFRLSADEYLAGGITLEESKIMAKKLQEAGVNALHVVAGHIDARGGGVPPMGAFTEGCFVHFAEEIKKLVSIPVITTGRIRDPQMAESILEEGKADLIGMARQLIADPEWPNKVKKGNLDEIRWCPGCNLGCANAGAVFVGRNMKCTVNASVGREKDYRITKADKARKVVVVGGGPAGMETARVAALRGHHVILFEKEQRLGGQLWLASASPYKADFLNFTKYLITQMEKRGIDVRLGQEATPKALESIGADVVVIATGAKQYYPQIPGIDSANVYSAWDILAERATVKGDKVVVAGGGTTAMDVAEFLALKGKKISMVIRYSQLGETKAGMLVEHLGHECLLERFIKYGVTVIPGQDLIEVDDKGVTVENRRSRRKENLYSDSVVIALGAVSNNELTQKLTDDSYELYTIGDAVKPRRIQDAINEGSFIGRQI